MSDKEHNIDIVFRNGLKDFEVLPPASIWNRIPPVIPVRTWRRHVYPVAATVAILMTLGASLSILFRKPLANSDQLTVSSIPTEQKINTANPVDAPADAKVLTMNTDPGIAEAKSETVTQIAGVMDPSVPSLATNHQAEIVIISEVTESAAVSEKSLLASQLIDVSGFDEKGKELAFVEEKSTDLSRLMIGGSLSPAFSVLSSGGDADVSDLMQNETALPTYTGGLSVSLNINHRLTIQTGIGLTTMGQTISGIKVGVGLSQYYRAKGDYTYMVETASGVLVAENSDLYLSDAISGRVGSFIPEEFLDPSKLKLEYIESDIRQLFRYLEVPVIARYKIVDRKMDLNLSGGVAYGFLIENSAYAVDDKNSVKIGYTKGVNEHSFSSQVGFGMEYDVSKTVVINLEPVFRYYLTPFSDRAGAVSRPYSFGVFSGFSFRF